MKFLSFTEFVNESIKTDFTFYDEHDRPLNPADFKKVQFLTETYDIHSNYGFKYIACNTMFKLITVDNMEELDPDMPIVNFGLNSTVQDLIDKKKINPKNLYNKPADKAISGSKQDFHKTFMNESFLPKTVFTPKDTKSLKFPVVAKPSVGHSGIGITKFDTHKELMAYDSLEDFDVFSEAIKIETEVRLVYLKDELICFMVREAQDDKSKFLQGKQKSMGKQKAEDELDFMYHIHLPEELALQIGFSFAKIERKKKLQEIVTKIRKKVPLEFLTIDLAIDEDKELWVLEINTEPGSSGVMLSNLYEAIFRDFYKRPMDETSTKCLKDVELKLINFTLQTTDRGEKYKLSNKFVDKYIK